MVYFFIELGCIYWFFSSSLVAYVGSLKCTPAYTVHLRSLYPTNPRVCGCPPPSASIRRNSSTSQWESEKIKALTGLVSFKFL